MIQHWLWRQFPGLDWNITETKKLENLSKIKNEFYTRQPWCQYVTTNDRGKITECQQAVAQLLSKTEQQWGQEIRTAGPGTGIQNPAEFMWCWKFCKKNWLLSWYELRLSLFHLYPDMNLLSCVFLSMKPLTFDRTLKQDLEHSADQMHVTTALCHLCHKGPFFVVLLCLAWFFIKVQRRKTATFQLRSSLFLWAEISGLHSGRKVPEFEACRSWKGSSTAQLWQFGILNMCLKSSNIHSSIPKQSIVTWCYMNPRATWKKSPVAMAWWQWVVNGFFFS